MVNLHIFSFFHLPHCGSQCKSSSLPRKVLMFWTTPMWTNVIWKYWGVIWTNPKDTEGYQQDFMKRVAAHATYLPSWVCKDVFGLLPLWYLDIFWTNPLEFWTTPIGLTNQIYLNITQLLIGQHNGVSPKFQEGSPKLIFSQTYSLVYCSLSRVLRF